MSTVKKLGLVAFAFLFANVGLAMAEDAVTTSATTSTTATTWSLITDRSIARNAGISYSKLNLADSIMTTDIKDEQIKHDNIGDGAINSRNINEHAITNEHLSEDFEFKIADGSVTSAGIEDGTIMNVDVAANADIDGTKIDPDFGAQDVITTGDGYFDNFYLTGNIDVNGYLTDSSDDAVQIGDNSNDNVLLMTGTDEFAGNVGINTATPNAFLEVVNVASGSMNGRDTFRLSNNANQDILRVSPGGRMRLENYARDTAFYIYNDDEGRAEYYDFLRMDNDMVGNVASISYDGNIWANGYVEANDYIWTGGNIELNGYLTDGSDNNIQIGDNSDDVITMAGTINSNLVPTDVSADSVSDYDLGANVAGSRWSTIYADTLNYAQILTDSQNLGDGADVIMGLTESNGDTVTINADTQIVDDEWSIDYNGVATFNGNIFANSNLIASNSVTVGGGFGGGGASILTGGIIQTEGSIGFLNGETISNATDGVIEFSAGTDADVVLTANGTGNITIGDSDSDVTVYTFIANNDATLGDSSGDTVTINGTTTVVNGTGFTANGPVMLGDNGDKVEIDSDTWNVSDLGVASGLTGITSTGRVDFGAASLTIPNGNSLPGLCSSGQLFQDTDSDDCADTGAGDGALCICKAGSWTLISNF